MINTQKPYNDLIVWIENYYKEKNSRVKPYRGFEVSKEFDSDVKDALNKGVEFSIDPMLPIDLLTVEKRKRKLDDKNNKYKLFNFYELFWIVFDDNENLERTLQFYRFYLSRISKLEGVEIIMVIPTDIDKALKENIKKKASDNGFGLWEVDIKESEPNIIYKPMGYRKRMENIFRNPIDFDEELTEFPKSITDSADDIALFFDGFIRESVEAMVGVTSKQIGKRYIERKILDLVFRLNNVFYSGKLKEIVTTHLLEKGNDYDFVSDTFSTLWKECDLKIEYTDFLKTCEPPLFNIFSKNIHQKPYRDHYFHQFQVFLVGLYIIDNFYNLFSKDKPIHQIEKQWLITSSFHDMAYPIQLFDIWAQVFFQKSIGIPDMGVTDMTKHFVEKSLLTCTTDIINSLCKIHFNKKNLHDNWLREENKLLTTYHKVITERKHHGVISSIFLLKEAYTLNDKDILEQLFIPAALSISLHHDITYKDANNQDTSLWKEFKKYGLKFFDFNNDCLTFLLLFCDAAQEWGRPKDFSKNNIIFQNKSEKKDKENGIEDNDKCFILDKIKASSPNCHITIKSNFTSDDDPFIKKVKELENIRSILKKPKCISFQITLFDKSGERHDYKMK